MESQVVPSGTLAEAERLIEAGGDGVRDGVAALLVAVQEQQAGGGSGGKDCSYVLTCALRRLHDDAYLALGVNPEAEDGEIKKAYRKLALRFHPDKNRATGSLFQAIQGGYDVLSDPEKRPAYDEKRRRQQAALAKLRKQQPKAKPQQQQGPPSAAAAAPAPAPAAAGTGAAKGKTDIPGNNGERKKATREDGSSSRSGGGAQPAPQPKGWRAGQTEDDKEKMREFNKRFYAEFRKAAQDSQQKSKHSRSGAEKGGKDGRGGGGSSNGAADSSPNQVPPRPRMRSIGRTDVAVTLEWNRGDLPVTTAYELQWRQRGRVATEWITSPTFIVGTQCRKKNLQPCTCYEFRIRAASAWGWSEFSDAVMVVTLSGGGDEVNSQGSAPQRQRVSNFYSDGSNSKAEGGVDHMARAKVQVQEARKRRDAERRASSRESASTAAQEAAARLQQKTNSWYWRRMSAAAAQPSSEAPSDKKGSSATGNSLPPRGAEQDSLGATPERKHDRRRTHTGGSGQKAGAWKCSVCQRSNEGSATNCWVCYTARSYRSENLSRISISRGGARPSGMNSPPEERERSEIKRNKTESKAEESESGKFPDIKTPAAANSTSTAAGREPAGTKAVGEAPSHQGAEKIPSIRVSVGVAASASASASGNEQRQGYNVDGIRVRPAHNGQAGGEGSPGQENAARPTNPDDVWECTEDDIFSPPSGAASTDTSDDEEWSYAEEEASTDKEAPSVWLLNPAFTKLHNVRMEPLPDSQVVGHLYSERAVNVLAEVGNWCKVDAHAAAGASHSSERRRSSLNAGVTPPSGWCLRESDTAVYLIRPAPATQKASSPSTPARKSDEPADGEQRWYELHDDEGAVYYFNSATGASQWEPPPWVDEIDPVSGSVYYVNSLTGDAQWEMPQGFVPIVREIFDFQKTPEANFMKSVLSPKRSKGAMSFKQHLERSRLGLSCSIHRMQTMMEEKLGLDEADSSAEDEQGEGGATDGVTMAAAPVGVQG